MAAVAAEQIAAGAGREWALSCLVASRMMTSDQAQKALEAE